MNRTIRTLMFAALAAAALAGAAQAIQPGTTGTEKRFQQQGLRIGVPVMVNNTATATVDNAGVTSTATLNGGAGVITTDSLTTAALTDWMLTLTNNMIAAGDIVLVTVGNGTNTTANPMVSAVTPGAGSVTIAIRNNSQGAKAFNGTLKIGFVVIKQTALNQD